MTNISALHDHAIQQAREEKDAARYRWLRTRWARLSETYGANDRVVEKMDVVDDETMRSFGWESDIDPDSLDAAIDAAMGLGSPHEQPAARWYMVDKTGMATLCADREDAEQEAKDAQAAWPQMGPHRAVQLVEMQGDGHAHE